MKLEDVLSDVPSKDPKTDGIRVSCENEIQE